MAETKINANQTNITASDIGGLTNNTSNSGSLAINGTISGTGARITAIQGEITSGNAECSVVIGNTASVRSHYSVAVGTDAFADYYSTAIGKGFNAGGTNGIAIGAETSANAQNAIQLGSLYRSRATNSDANTFKVANANGNFEIMSADGTIPAARIPYVPKTITSSSASGYAANTIVQYVGTTDATCTNGYFYKAGIVPSSATISQTTGSGMNDISVLDASYLCYHMFDGCTGLTSPGLESVEFISDSNCCAYMYKGCTGITVARLTSLIGNRPVSSTSCFTHMFDGCTNLTDVYMDSVHISAFNGSTPSSEFSAFLSGVTGCTVHLPSNMTSMASWSFGGTNTVVVNDLSPTYEINTDETGTTSNELYFLSKKRSTANHLTWIRWFSVNDLVSEWDFVYTSGSEIPSVGDYVYSDPECTIQGKAIVNVNG